MNKTGGVFSAGTLLIILVIYFTFFILIVASSDSLVNDEDTTLISIDNYDFSGIVGQNYCDNPRFKYNAKTSDIDQYKQGKQDSLKCEQSAGVLDSVTCNNIQGCIWNTTSSGFWFWETSFETCTGNINATYYGVNVTGNPNIIRPRVASHTNTGLWGTLTPFLDPSPCSHPNVIFNKTNCDVFSCSWKTVQMNKENNNVNNIYSSVKQVFTFRHDFGIENSTVSYILQFIFIIIPLILLIISLYYMLPILH